MKGTQIRPGMLVRSRDGYLLGEVFLVSDEEVVIAAGDFFRRDQTITTGDIHHVDGVGLILEHDRATMRAVNEQLGAIPPSRFTPRPEAEPARPHESEPPREPLRPSRTDRRVRSDDEQGLQLRPRDLQKARMGTAEHHHHGPRTPKTPLPLGGALHLTPREFEAARMDSVKFDEEESRRREGVEREPFIREPEGE